MRTLTAECRHSWRERRAGGRLMQSYSNERSHGAAGSEIYGRLSKVGGGRAGDTTRQTTIKFTVAATVGASGLRPTTLIDDISTRRPPATTELARKYPPQPTQSNLICINSAASRPTRDEECIGWLCPGGTFHRTTVISRVDIPGRRSLAPRPTTR